jgi:CYTH domain-containing protein
MRKFFIDEYTPKKSEARDMEKVFMGFFRENKTVGIQVRVAPHAKAMTAYSWIVDGNEAQVADMSPDGASEIMREAFDNLIVKHEYFVGPWVLMFYKGCAEGLCVAEIELEEGKKLPKLPKHLKLGEEITNESQYYDLELFIKGSKTAKEKMTLKMYELKKAAVEIMEEVATQNRISGVTKPIDDCLL